MIIHDDKYINRVWLQWLAETHAGLITKSKLNDRYINVIRRNYIAQQFENWLWGQGAAVQQINKKCYLQFNDEEDAMVFKLRNY